MGEFIFVIWIMCAAIGAAVGSQKNASGYGCILGLLLGPIGVLIAAFIDCRVMCPNCHVRLNKLNKEKPSVCPSCHLSITWIEDQGFSPEAWATREKENAERERKAKERREKWVQEQKKEEVKRGAIRARRHEQMQRTGVHAVDVITMLPRRFDEMLRSIAGHGNDLVLWFLYTLFIGATLLVLVILAACA